MAMRIKGKEARKQYEENIKSVYEWFKGTITPAQMEDILELLETRGMLNRCGKTFRHQLWEKYVKEQSKEG